MQRTRPAQPRPGAGTPETPTPPDSPVRVARRPRPLRPTEPDAPRTAPVTPRDSALVSLSDTPSPPGSPRQLVSRSLGARGSSVRHAPRQITQRGSLRLSSEDSRSPHQAARTPEGLAAERAVTHRTGLTDATKALFYGQWAGGVAGRALSNLGGAPEAAAVFAALSAIGMLFDGYSTEKDARHARHDHVSAAVLLVQQQAWQRALEADPATDPALLAQLAFQIRALARLQENFERAYYPASQQPYLAGIRARLADAAATVAGHHAEVDALAARHAALLARIAARRGPADLLEVDGPLEALEAERDAIAARLLALGEAVDEVLDHMDRLLSRRALREAAQHELKAARARLAEAQASGDADAAQALEDRVRALQDEVAAFGRDWTRAFRPFDGLAPHELKRLRDVHIQLPRVALESAHTALSLAHLVVEVVGAQFGLYGLSAVSQLMLGFMARVDNKDGKREQAQARAAKCLATERLCAAAQLLHDSEALADARTRALHRAVGGAVITTQQRTLRTLHRATGQAKIRRGKGLAGYGTVVAAILGGALSLGLAPVSGGASLAALPFVGLPGGLNGTAYIGSVAVRALQRQHDKDQLKARTAAAEAFVRRFGVDAILDFYVDLDSDDPERAAAWTTRLQRLWQDWFEAWRAQRREAVDEAEFEIEPHLLLPAHLRDNECLALEYLTEALHRHAADALTGPCAAAGLLALLGMSADTLAHLLGGLGAWATPEQHRQSVRQCVAAFLPMRLYPSRRLLGRLQRQPGAIVARVERELARHWQQRLSPDMQARVGAWLDRLLALPPDRRIDWLNQGERPVRQTLVDLLRAVRDRLQERLIGPQDLLRLQQALVGGEDLPPWAAGGALLAEPWGPLLLELLADPSLVAPHTDPAPGGTAPPSTGPALLARLVDALKLAGDGLRDGEASPADAPAPGRWGRRVAKRLRQTGPNPLATPGRALARLRDGAPAERRRLGERILRAFAARCAADGLAEDPPALLARARATAQQVLLALEQRRLQALRLGRERPPSRDRLLADRLQDTVALCELLLAPPPDSGAALQMIPS